MAHSDTKKKSTSASFPTLPDGTWRTKRPLIVTLSNGDRLPAYPVLGTINESGEFCIGDSCGERMWLVADQMIESPLITKVGETRIIAADAVIEWKTINTAISV